MIEIILVRRDLTAVLLSNQVFMAIHLVSAVLYNRKVHTRDT